MALSSVNAASAPTTAEAGFISERAQRCLQPALSYGAAFAKALKRVWRVYSCHWCKAVDS